MELSPNPPGEIWQNLGRLYTIVALSSAQQRQLKGLYIDRVKEISGKIFDAKTGWLYMAYIPRASVQPSEPEPVPNPGATTPEAGANMRVFGSGTGFVVHPKYVLTNAHVVKDADAFLIVGGEERNARFSARKFAVSERKDRDLALLYCEELAAPPLQFSGVAPRLAAELYLLGFPLSFDLGSKLKATRGILSSLPPHAGMVGDFEKYKDYYLYNATTNPGNSGGPMHDISGRVVAVHTAGLMRGAPGGGYPAGLPVQYAEAFVKEHVEGYLPKGVKSDPTTTWEDAVALVGKSTFQILVLGASERVASGDTFHAERGRKATWRPYEDPWCMACKGTGYVKCPVRGCANGKVRATRTVLIAKDAHGNPIVRHVPIRVPCETCGGKGVVPCPDCDHGIDRSLRSSPSTRTRARTRPRYPD